MTKGIGEVKLSVKLSGKLSVKLSSKKTQKWVTDHYQLSIVADRRKKQRENEVARRKKGTFLERSCRIKYKNFKIK